MPPWIATFAPSPAITRPTAKSSRSDAVTSFAPHFRDLLDIGQGNVTLVRSGCQDHDSCSAGSLRMIFDGDVSTGAADDLQRATEIAVEMVTKYGMNATEGQRTYAPRPQALLLAITRTRWSALLKRQGGRSASPCVS